MLNVKEKIFLIVLFFLLLSMSLQFISTRSIKLNWTPAEATNTRFRWLDSVNFYLETGKILMNPGNHRLEESSVGEDQGYPLILSILGRLWGLQEMSFGGFIKFNYLLLISLGIVSSVLLFLSFKSLIIATAFYYLYLKIGIYGGHIDHHWILGAFIPFYLTFLIFFLKNRSIFKSSWFVIYFLIAGVANIMREGNGVVALLILSLLFIILMIQDGFKKFIPKPIFRTRFPYLHKNILLLTFLILIYISPMLILDGVRKWRNGKYFNGQPSNMITHHGLWHSAFIGLGYIPNKYGIEYADPSGVEHARKINPNVKYQTNEYHDILRGLYFKYSLESPSFWFDSFFAKVKTLHKEAVKFSAKFIRYLFPDDLNNYLPYGLLSAIFIISRKNKTSLAIFWLILAAILTSSVPALVAKPTTSFIVGFQAALFMAWFYFISLIYFAIKDFLKTHLPNQPFFDFL